MVWLRCFSEAVDRLPPVAQATPPLQYILRIGVRVRGIHDLPRLTLFSSVCLDENWQLNSEIAEEPNHRIPIEPREPGSGSVGHW